MHLVSSVKNETTSSKISSDRRLLRSKLFGAVSAGSSLLHKANVELQKIAGIEITSEIAGKSSKNNVDEIVNNLESSNIVVSKIIDMNKSMIINMKKDNLVDSPTLATMDLPDLGEKFISAKLVDSTSWMNVSEKMESGGSLAMFSYFENKAESIKAETTTLIKKIKGANFAAQSGTLNAVIAENQPENFLVELTQLYTSWSTFEQNLIAFNSLARDIEYRDNNVGSLLESNITQQKQTA